MLTCRTCFSQKTCVLLRSNRFTCGNAAVVYLEPSSRRITKRNTIWAERKSPRAPQPAGKSKFASSVANVDDMNPAVVGPGALLCCGGAAPPVEQLWMARRMPRVHLVRRIDNSPSQQQRPRRIYEGPRQQRIALVAASPKAARRRTSTRDTAAQPRGRDTPRCHAAAKK